MKHSTLSLIVSTLVMGRILVSAPASATERIAETTDPPLLSHSQQKDGPRARLAPTQSIPAQALASFVDGAVKAGMTSLNVAGAEIAIVQRDGQVWVRGYGLANVEPARPVDPARTLFRVGSISKIFTWILLLREVERGRIDLNAPVNDYLPDVLQIPDQGFEQPVRIVHLLSHSPGFESRSTGEFVKDPSKILALEQRLKLQFPDRVFEPGMLSSYSDQGAELAGYIVARLAGVDFETLAEREIFEPLGLEHTTFRQPHPARHDLPRPMAARLAADVSTGFGWSGGDYRARPFEYTPSPSGSLSTTAADMTRVMLLLLNGGSLDGVTLYGPETAKSFRTPLMNVPEGVNGWAHGFIVYGLPGGFKGYGHSGGMLSFLSNMLVIPDLGLGVFVTTNTNTGWGLAERLPAAIVEHFYVPPSAAPRRKGSPSLVKQAQLYEGRYITTRRAYSGLERFRYLLRSSGAVSVTADGYLFTAGQKWAEEGTRGWFRSLDGAHVLRFRFDSHGRALSYLDESGTALAERVGLLLDRRPFFSLAVLTVLAALATLVGVVAGVVRDSRQTRWQCRWRISAGITAALWLICIAAFASWSTQDTLTRVYSWPGSALLTGSAAALLAALGSISLGGLVPLASRDARWSIWRKVREVAMVGVFLLFGAMLATWSALIPWNW